MPLEHGMRDTVVQGMTQEEIEKMREKIPRWFHNAKLDIYVDEFGRTDLQGNSNWYPVMMNPDLQRDADIFVGKKNEAALLYITGTKDWLVYQHPFQSRKSRQCAVVFAV